MRGRMIARAAIARGCGVRILILLLAASPASRAALACGHEEQAGPLRVGWAWTAQKFVVFARVVYPGFIPFGVC